VGCHGVPLECSCIISHVQREGGFSVTDTEDTPKAGLSFFGASFSREGKVFNGFGEILGEVIPTQVQEAQTVVSGVLVILIFHVVCRIQ
jgi:hypothetical protein